MKRFYNNLYQVSKVIVIILPIILLAWLIKKDLVMSGVVEFSYDFSENVPYITTLFPENRLSQVYQTADDDFFWREILQEPVYFETRLPQTFARAEVELIYQNNILPLIQLGLKTQGDGDWSYEFKPLENQLLDELDWFKLESDEGTLWQKTKTYLSWDQFQTDLYKTHNLASYYYPLDRQFRLENYQPQAEIISMDKALRGKHQFYTYLKNEPLDFTFVYQDINRLDGPDSWKILVYNEKNQKIFAKEIADDDRISKLDPASKKTDVKIFLENLKEGVYKISLEADDEIIFREIKTRQQYLTFIDRLYLADSPEYGDGLIDLEYKPTVIYSAIPRLGFETAHSEGLQSVGINENQSLTISQTHEPFFVTPTKVPSYLYVPKNDLKIFGRGLLALSESAYFNPEIYSLRDITFASGIDYLISEYKTPANLNGWKKSTVSFDLQNAEIVNRKLKFVISAPELNFVNASLRLASLKITLIKEPMTWPEVWSKFKNYVFNKF